MQPRSGPDPRAPRLPQPGEEVDGLVIRDVIADGGMGRVFRAHDGRLGRDVAVKMVRPRWLSVPRLRDGVVEEARAIARVRHPNVVQVFSLGEHRGLPYFVMEHVPGCSLEDQLQRGWAREAPLEERRRVLEGICEGLGAIHRADLVHGDIKPSNVLLGEDGRIALVDMGLARLLDHPDWETPGRWGTPAYLAPELARGDRVRAHMLPLTDLYSTSVVAFELLTGRLPFEATDPEDMLRMRVDRTAPRASSLRPSLSPAFDRPLALGLDRDPRRRPQSAAELYESLRHVFELVAKARDPLRFLVADDDPDHAEIVSRVLARSFPGSVVETCPDGQSALHAARRRQPSLAVIDLNMPGLNGVELTAALRQDAARTPIVVLTGEGNGTDWRLLQRLGADRFIVKPMVTEAFVTTVRTLIEERRRNGGPDSS